MSEFLPALKNDLEETYLLVSSNITSLPRYSWVASSNAIRPRFATRLRYTSKMPLPSIGILDLLIDEAFETFDQVAGMAQSSPAKVLNDRNSSILGMPLDRLPSRWTGLTM